MAIDPRFQPYLTKLLAGLFAVFPPGQDSGLGIHGWGETLNFLTAAIMDARDAVTANEAGIATAVNAHGDTNTNAVRTQLTSATSQLLTAIAGGALSQAQIDAIVAAIGGLQAWLQAIASALTAQNAADEAGAVDDVRDAIIDESQQSRDAFKPLFDALKVDTPQLQKALDDIYAGEAGKWVTALPKWLQFVGAILGDTAPIWAPGLIAEAIEHFPALATQFGDYGQTVAHGIAEGINVLHRPMEVVIETSASVILRNLQDEVFNIGQTNPGNVDHAAARLLAIAGGYGMAAHLVAVAAEKLVGTKHLGFPQLAAYLADAASFGKIAGNTVGAQIEAALRSPARRRALAQFRPELPDAGSFIEQWYERGVSDAEFLGFFREQGWSEEAVGRQSQSAFRKASPRELAMVFEDGEIDPAWGLRMLQRLGFNDDDAAFLIKGVLSRAAKSIRQEYVTAVVANITDGVYDTERAAGFLRDIGVSEPNISMHVGAAQHKAYHREVTQRATALVDAHVLGATTEEELFASLAALGLSDRERLHRLSVARIKRGAKVFVKAASTQAAAETRMRAEETKAALAAFHRFIIDEAGLRENLLAIGIDPAEVDASVQLAVVEREPVPRLGSFLSPAAQLEEQQKVQRQTITELQKKGVIGESEAAGQLAQLGLSPDAARLDARLTAARLVPPELPAAGLTPTQLQREEISARTTGAIDLFKQGLTNAATLRADLIRAGNPAELAEAIVARELDRRAADRARAANRDAATEFRREQVAERDAATAAFRSGTLDETGLLETLLAIGFTAPVAASIVEREKTLKATRDEQRAARAASTEADRVLRADQQAGILAFRAGKLSADELEQWLLDVGTPADEAAALRRREEARKKAPASTAGTSAAGA